jgi:hypothetical protein
MTKTKKQEDNTKKPKKIRPFRGIVIGIFEDTGPVARYKITRIPYRILDRVVVHGMSSVHGGEDMMDGLYGPLPMFDMPKKRYLIYSFKVSASNTKDSRIAEHGRVCSIFLIIDQAKQRYILNQYEAIEGLLRDFIAENWTKELKITRDSMKVLFRKLNQLIDITGIRSFSYSKAGLIEFDDPKMVLDEGILSVIDEKRSYAYIYVPKEKFDVKQRIAALEKLEEINNQEYASRLKIKKYKDYVKFKQVLERYTIQLIK